MRQYKMVIKIDTDKIFEAFLHDDLSVEIISESTIEPFERKKSIINELTTNINFMKAWGVTSINCIKL